MKRIKYVIIIVLILIFIILKIKKSPYNNTSDVMIFNLWSSTSNQEKLRIDVFSTIQNGNNLYRKISPGSYGKFIIKLEKAKQLNCKIVLRDVTQKPKNLIFYLDDEIFYSIEKMESKINEKFRKNDKIIINWQWPYETNEKEDIQDTKDGEKIQKYVFEIEALIE